MIRTIDGFHQDDVGDWVAELACLHNQHVRHRPPFDEREWVTTEASRMARIGSPIDCPLCDRLELPSGLQIASTLGPFSSGTIPARLLRDHVIADRTWGVLQVLEGAVDFAINTTPPISERLVVGDLRAIPPGVHHHLADDELVTIVIDLLVEPH